MQGQQGAARRLTLLAWRAVEAPVQPLSRLRSPSSSPQHPARPCEQEQAAAAAAKLASAAAALEPSPEQALAAGKAAVGAPGAAPMQRQGSSRENALDLCNL